MKKPATTVSDAVSYEVQPSSDLREDNERLRRLCDAFAHFIDFIVKDARPETPEGKAALIDVATAVEAYRARYPQSQ